MEVEDFYRSLAPFTLFILAGRILTGALTSIGILNPAYLVLFPNRTLLQVVLISHGDTLLLFAFLPNFP